MDLPLLDCHAHVSPNVTDRQLARLEGAIVFAMTREPSEAKEATLRHDDTLLWGCGAHPSFVARGGEIGLDDFAIRSKSFPIVGEIGLDRRSGNIALQQEVFQGILDRLKNEPVLMSIHTAGCGAEAISLLKQHPHPGIILHWFTGSLSEANGLLSMGCYFSVNTAMPRELIHGLPMDRLLPETDFPAVRKRTGARPGDTAELESLLGAIHGTTPSAIRRQFYRNLRRISVGTGAIDRMPTHVSDLLLTA